jgi:ATP-dependent helicase/nuclease subunit B
MSLQLILGGAGSGKTTYLYDTIIRESIKHPDQLYYIIVPEQFTMQTQKDIVTRHPRHGTMNIDIVSFQRLAYRIFEELAVEQLDVLDDMGKSMVLRKAATACRKELVLFQKHLGQTGFISRLKTTVSEFYQYGITSEVLKELAPEAKNPLLKLKLEEFAAIFQEFQDYIAGHYITTEEVLDVLCRVLPESKLIKNSVIALDGYAGYMPVQYRLIGLFMRYARQVVVTVTADRSVPVDRPVGMQNLFAMTSQMVCRLNKLADDQDVKVLPAIWLEGTKTHADGLAFLERNLFRYRKKAFTDPEDHSIEIRQASNPSAEIRDVVHQIQKLVTEDGLRYRDLAVVTGDLDGYGKEISHQFEQNGIPCFLDDKRTMLDNPLVEMIRAALEVVQRDFSYESVFRYLRSGMPDTDERMLDRLENYVLALGIRGQRRWKETWTYTYRGADTLNLEELNAYKDALMQPLYALMAAFRAEGLTIRGMSEAVLQLLADVDAQKRMEAYQQMFVAQGDLRLAKEYGQIYELVENLLKRLADLLGEETAARKEFAEILDAGFAEISVGVIPATIDRVMVGDIMRTRLAHIKVLFFVGVNDGIVPSRKEGGSLLTDQEREFFTGHQLELAPTAKEDSFQQRFFLYRMMTKPTQKLIVSYSGVGADGKGRRPSYLIGELRKMFPLVKIQEAWDGTEEIYSIEEARRLLIGGLHEYRENPLAPQEGQSAFLELYRYFADSEEYKDEIRTLTDAAFYIYEKQGISHAAAQVLYGKVISGSVTRLEQYAQCAYGHFLKYGLELMERQEYALNAADIGNLFHDSIDRCFKEVREAGKDWHTLSDAERTSLVSRVVEQVTADYGNTILESSSRNAFLAKRVEQITQKTVWALQQQIQKGDFSPAGFEVSFSAADNLDALKITLSEDEAVHLRGRVDRLDLCEDGQNIYVKIIDYKSGSTSFDLVALYYGLQLQLVVYMDAVMEITKRRNPGKEVVPAGILYYNIADPVVDKDSSMADADGEPDEEVIRHEILKALKMNGLVNSELEVIRHMDHSIETASDIIPVVLKNGEVQAGRSSVANRERFESLRSFVHEKVRRTGQEILNGEIGIEPYKNGQRTACDYCPYHAVCGFDKKVPGYRNRKFKKMKSEEIWEKICQ